MGKVIQLNVPVTPRKYGSSQAQMKVVSPDIASPNLILSSYSSCFLFHHLSCLHLSIILRMNFACWNAREVSHRVQGGHRTTQTWKKKNNC